MTARAAELRTSCQRLVCVAGRLSNRVAIVNFRMNERGSDCAGIIVMSIVYA